MKNSFYSISLFLFTAFFALGMSKKPVEVSAQAKTTKVSGKSIGYFQVSIESQDNGNGDLTLVAHVLPRQAMNGSEFQWKTPENLKAIAGSTSGALDLKKDEEHQFSLVISKNQMKDGDQIFFFIYKMVNGERHGGSHSFVYSNDDIKKSSLEKSSKKTPKYFE